MTTELQTRLTAFKQWLDAELAMCEQATNRIWLIWSHEHNAWWRPNSAGYTRHIESAGSYTKAKASEICRQRGPKKFEEDPPHEVAVIAPEFENELARTGYPLTLAMLRTAVEQFEMISVWTELGPSKATETLIALLDQWESGR